MAQAALGLAFERAQEAALIVDAYVRESRALDHLLQMSAG
jgi:hypothetical protein